jgi:hypothetical protein
VRPLNQSVAATRLHNRNKTAERNTKTSPPPRRAPLSRPENQKKTTMSGGPPSPYKPGDVLNGRYVIEEEINRE